MGSVVSLCTILIPIYISSAISDNSQKISKEWIFQFDLTNKNNWDNYQITQKDENTLNGESNGCTSRIPVIFKKLCVDWNDNDGFALKFKSSTNLHIDPNYDDVIWYYGDHKTAKMAEKAAKEQYVDLEERELTEIAHDNDASFTLRRRLINTKRKTAAQKCYWYGDARACAHIDASNKNLMTVSVGLNEEDNNDNDYFGAADNDYGDYDDEDYNNYDMNALYAQYMQQQQALYNQQWAQYLQQLNNLYYQNMLQQQQQQQQYVANAYDDEYDNLYDDVYEDDEDEDGDDNDSDDKEEDDDDDEEEGGGDDLGAGMMGISENDIMQKAEAEARKHVEAKMEKKLESKLEKQMMSKLDHGFDQMAVHKKHSIAHYGEEMDKEHFGMPADEMEEEEMRNETPPHDSLSESAPA